jgi:uncharacterized small protein (DUF1192 family)
MKNLEHAQREMRDRQKLKTDPKPIRKRKPPTTVGREREEIQLVVDTNKLQQRISALENENQRLRAEVQQLRRQKTVYVEVERRKSADEERREQQHNYFKYSNARRW